MKKNYQIVIGDLPEYEKLVVYLYYGESLKDAFEDENSPLVLDLDRYEIALLSQEEGADKVKLSLESM